MTFASHIFSEARVVRRLLAAIAWLALLLACIMCALIAGAWQERDTFQSVASASPDWHAVPPSLNPDFSVFQGPVVGDENTNAVAFLSVFRYAGSFFITGGATATLRRGVLSYIPESRQEIVSEGSLVAGVRVKSIGEDYIVLEKNGVEGTLSLGSEKNPMMESYLDQPLDGDAESGPKQTPFGERTGEGVWTLQKEALQDYYEELLENPERLLQVFDSMAPLYGEDGSSIKGYQLQAVGEKAFFDAVGFQEGDIVRKVNALPMTNRGRAEFFIKQVVKDRMSAVVIDIERDGQAKRLVYQLR